MLRIQGAERTKTIAARTFEGQIVRRIPGLLCPRKHVINKEGWNELKKANQIFCFVSSPLIYKQEKLRKLSKGWCHALRNKKQFPSKIPQILLPESDFLDRNIVFTKPTNNIKYDYFYFTLNARAGIEHKGLYHFFDILPILCKYKLKGKVIVYFPNMGRPRNFVVHLSKKHRYNLEKYGHYLDFHWGLLRDQEMNDIMTSCRFGLFPNIVDNSPRILSETLIRNIPVLVNEQIHGGWHYINKETGYLYNLFNLEEAIDFMKTNSFHAYEYYISRFGFEKSSRRLARFLKKIFGYDKFSHVYFDDFYQYLEMIHEDTN